LFQDHRSTCRLSAPLTAPLSPRIVAMRVVFACGAMVGHLNPMLALAKHLADIGHEVHFRSMPAARAKVEATGALYYDAVAQQPEFYEGRQLFGPLGALEDLMKEHGLDASSFLSHLCVRNIILEQQLPGSLRFLREVRPDVVVYDALVSCRDVMVAARLVGIPAVGVWSLAGPGAWLTHSAATMLPLTLDEAHRVVARFSPHAEATARLQETYGLDLCQGLPQPAGKMDTFDADVTLVTTCADLQDPLPEELASAYARDGIRFECVGPLLMDGASANGSGRCNSASCPGLLAVQQARASGRVVAFASMGTVVTSDHSLNGWLGRSGGSSLTGQQLCRAAWGGAFDAFGAASAEEGVLLVVSLGPQPDALGDLSVPPNAVCLPFVDQQRMLKAGVDVFLTHGGQNSFTEAMMLATPVVVCPGFGDQVVNSRKAEALSVGVRIDRPEGELDTDGAVARQYRADVRDALLRVRSEPTFRHAASRCSDTLRKTGGLPRAVELVLRAGQRAGAPAAAGKPAPSMAGAVDSAMVGATKGGA